MPRTHTVNTKKPQTKVTKTDRFKKKSKGQDKSVKSGKKGLTRQEKEARRGAKENALKLPTLSFNKDKEKVKGTVFLPTAKQMNQHQGFIPKEQRAGLQNTISTTKSHSGSQLGGIAGWNRNIEAETAQGKNVANTKKAESEKQILIDSITPEEAAKYDNDWSKKSAGEKSKYVHEHFAGGVKGVTKRTESGEDIAYQNFLKEKNRESHKAESVTNYIVQKESSKANKEVEDYADELQKQVNNGSISVDDANKKLESYAKDVSNKYSEDISNRMKSYYSEQAAREEKYLDRELAKVGKSRSSLQNAVAFGEKATEESLTNLVDGVAKIGAYMVAGAISPDTKGGYVASGHGGGTMQYQSKDKGRPTPLGNYVNLTKAEVEEYNKQKEISDAILSWAKNNALSKSANDISIVRQGMGESMSGANNTVGDIYSMTVQNIPPMVISMFNPAVGLGLFGLSAAGLSASSAYESGATIGEAINYGLLSGALEIATEKIFPAVGGAYGKAISSSLWRGFIGKATKAKAYRLLTETVEEALRNGRFANSVSGKILKGVLIGGGEATEEMIAEIVDPYLQRATFNPKADPATWEEIKEAGLMGFAVSAVLGVPVNSMSIANQIKNNLAVRSMTSSELDEWASEQQQKLQELLIKGDAKGYYAGMGNVAKIYNSIASRKGFEKGVSFASESVTDTNESIVTEDEAEELAEAQAKAQGGTSVSVIVDKDGKLVRRTYDVTNNKRKAVDKKGNEVEINNFEIVKNSGVDTELNESEFEQITKRYNAYKNSTSSIRSTGAKYGVKESVIKLAEQMQERTGLKFTFYKGERSDNGYIDDSTNTIAVNVNSKNAVAQIIAHEITHMVESHSGEAYDNLYNEIVEFYGDSYQKHEDEITGSATYKKQIAKKKTEEEKRKFIRDEMVARFIEQKLLTDSQTLERFTDLGRSSSEKVIDAINDIVIKTAGNKEQRVLVKLRKLWKQAYSEAIGAAKENESIPDVAENEKRYSKNLNDMLPKNWEEIAKKNVEVISTSNKHLTGTKHEVRDIIVNEMDSQFNEPVRNEETNSLFFLNRFDARHSLPNLSEYTISMALTVRKLAEKAKLIGKGRKDDGDKIYKTYCFISAMRKEGQKNILPVKVMVKEYNVRGHYLPKKVQEYINSHPDITEYAKLYDAKVIITKNNKTDGSSELYPKEGEMLTPSVFNTISLANLLEPVKYELKSYLPPDAFARHSYDINSGYSGASMSKRAEGEDNKRYSRDLDTPYLAAVERGDMETAQRMVDEAAKEDGYTVRAYHGTKRADRVGTVFRPDRATSGPMAFFTDNYEIAENYSNAKNDTSLVYDSDYDSYETQFRAKSSKHNLDMPLYEAWGYIPMAKRNEIKRKAGQLRYDWENDDYDTLILDEENTSGSGGFVHNLEYNRGNVIRALVDEWLNSANLFNEEERFFDVLNLTGITDALKKVGFDVEYKNPNYEERKVYDTYLKITKPFDTETVDEEFVRGFEEWYDEQDYYAYKTETANADAWDKNSVSAEMFAERLRRNIKDESTTAWTSIPDSMTDYLKSRGYDGIRDKGGKHGGQSHTVWIPFASEQVKSADPVTYDDNGDIIPLSQRFNDDNDDIRWSRDVDGISGDIKAAAKELLSDIRAVSYSRKRSDNEKAKQLINSIYGSIVRSGIYDHEKANELVDFLYETGYQNVEMDNAFEDVLSGSKILISDEFRGDMVSVGGLRAVNQKLFPYHITFAYNKHQHHNLDDYYTSFAAANKFVEESIDPAEQVAQIVDAYTAKVKKVSLEQLDREAYEEYGIEAENLYKKDIERAVFDFADTLVNLVSEQNEKRARKEGFKKGEAKSAAKAIKKGVKQEQREQRKRDEATLKEFDKMLKAQNREERKAAEEVLRLADKIINEARKEERALTKAEEKAIRDKVVADKNMVIKALRAIRKDLESEAARKEREQRRNDEANIRMHDKIVSGKDAAIKALNRKEEQRTAAERKKQRRAIIKADLQIAEQLAREERKQAKENRDKTHDSIARSKAKKVIDNFRTDIFNWLIGKNLWEFQTVKKDKNTNELVLVDEKNNVVASFNDEMGAFELAYFGRRGRFVPTAGLSYLAENVGMNVDRFYTIYYEIKNLQVGGKGKKKRIYDYINSLAITNRQKMFLMEYVAGYYAAEFPPFLSGGNITPPKENARGRMFEILDRISIDLFDEYKHPAIEDIDKLIEAAIPNATQEQKDAFKLFIEKRILKAEKDIEVARMDEYTKLAIEEETTNPTLRDKFKKVGKKLYRNVFADGYAIEKLADITDNPLLTARYYEAVKSSAIASRMINETFQEDIQGRAMGKSLYEIFKPIFKIKDNGKTLQDLTRYCNYRHDIDRQKYDKGYTGFTINELETKIKEIEDKYEKNGKNIIRETADLIVKYSRNLLYYNVQAGRISQETYDFFIERYPNYVPTYRVQEDQYIDRKGNIRTRDRKIIKEAKGGNETVLPLYTQLTRRTKEMVAAAKKNQLALEMVRSATEYAEGSEYIRSVITSEEDSSAESLWNEEDTGRITGLRESDSYIPVYIEGKRCKIDVIDEDILYGWDVINLPLKRCMATDVLEKINDIRRGVLTQYNVTFWATNLPKDISEMFMLNRHSLRNAKYLPVAVTTIFNPLTQTQQKRYAKGKYKAGEFSFKSNESAYNKKRDVALSEKERGYYQFLWDTYMSKGASQSSIFEYTAFSPRKMSRRNIKNGIKKIGTIPFNGLDSFNFLVEQTPRFTVFLEEVERLAKEREKGLNEYSDDEIYSVSAYAAADSTVNFSRSGRVTRYLNTYGFTFLNAGVQGFDKVRRAFDVRDTSTQKTILNILGLAFKLTAFGVGVGVLQEWLYGAFGDGDDDDSDEILKLLYGNDYKTVKERYRQLPDYVRYGYFVFWVDGEFVMIPRGRLVAAMNTAVQSSIRIATGEKTPYEGIKEGAGAFVSDVLPQTPFNGGVFQPIFDIVKNSDHWLNPIVSDWEDKGEGLHYLEYDEDTSQAAIDIAYAMHYLTGTLLGDEQALIDLSPLKIDYLIDQYAGSYKDFVRAVIGDNIEDDMITAAYNLAKKFVFNPIEKDRAAGDYYDFKERATNLAKADDNESPYAPLNSLFSEYSDSISKLRDEIKAVADDDSLSWAEKRSKTLALKDKLNDLYREALSDAKQLYQYSVATYSGKDDNSRIAQEWIMENKTPEWQFEHLSDSELDRYHASGLDKTTYVTALNAKKSMSGTETASVQDQFIAWLEYQDYDKAKKEKIFGAFYSVKDGYPVEFSDGSNGDSSLDLRLAGDEHWQVAKDAGISMTTYTHMAKKMGDFHSDYDENGKEIKGKKEYVAEYLNSLNISASEKAILWKTACRYKTDPPISFSNGGSEEVPEDLVSPLTSTGRLSTPFGYDIHNGIHNGRLHDGIDIAIPTGTPALACAEGEITKVTTGSGYGNYVEYKITSGKYKGYSIFYGHLSSIGVSVGDTVSAGRIIAKTGNTGNSTGPHIHIGARDASGNSIDPRTILDMEGLGVASSQKYSATVSGGSNTYGGSGSRGGSKEKRESRLRSFVEGLTGGGSSGSNGTAKASPNYSSSGQSSISQGTASAAYGSGGVYLPTARKSSEIASVASKTATQKTQRTARTGSSFA